MGELLLIKGVIQHFDQWKCPKRNAELVVVDRWGFKISTLEPLAAHCLFCVLSMPASQMTREQWLEFLMRISQERICLSCWLLNYVPICQSGGPRRRVTITCLRHMRSHINQICNSWIIKYQPIVPTTSLPVHLRQECNTLLMVSHDCRCEDSDDEPERC